MDAKLIKTEEGFYITHVPSGWYIGDTNHEKVENFKGEQGLLKLSLKNCQAIENGYDLDELAMESSKLQYLFSDCACYETAFIRGFLASVEILGDKKFSEEDMLRAYKQGGNDGALFESIMDYDSEDNDESWEFSEKAEKEFIQSLQQTEWDCIIEMECCGNYSAPCKYNCEYGTKPKLDADGCLILKRK